MAFQYLGLRAKLEHVDVTEEEVNRQLVRLKVGELCVMLRRMLQNTTPLMVVPSLMNEISPAVSSSRPVRSLRVQWLMAG